MFKNIEEIGNIAQINKSAQKAVRQKVEEMSQYGSDIWEDFVAKKQVLNSCRLKTQDYKFEIISMNNEIIFFMREKEKWIFPFLKTLHQYPQILPRFQIDKGGIKYIFAGANVMAPGLTSPGGHMDDVPASTVVAIYCEGKEHALAIGVTLMSTEEIRAKNTGHAVELVHSLGDKLYQIKDISKKK